MFFVGEKSKSWKHAWKNPGGDYVISQKKLVVSIFTRDTCIHTDTDILDNDNTLCRYEIDSVCSAITLFSVTYFQ